MPTPPAAPVAAVPTRPSSAAKDADRAGAIAFELELMLTKLYKQQILR